MTKLKGDKEEIGNKAFERFRLFKSEEKMDKEIIQ
jgi:hypothetical protein